MNTFMNKSLQLSLLAFFLWASLLTTSGCFNLSAGNTVVGEIAQGKQFLQVNIHGSSADISQPARVVSTYSTVCPSDNRPENFIEINDGTIKIPVNCVPGSFLDRVIVLLEPPHGYYFWGYENAGRQDNGKNIVKLEFTRQTHIKELNIREKTSFHMVYVDLTDMSMGALLRNLNNKNSNFEGKKYPALFYVSNYEKPLIMFRDTNGQSSISSDRFFNTLSRLHSSPPIIDNDIGKIDMLFKEYGLKASLDYLNLHVYMSGKSLEQHIHTIQRILNYLERQNKINHARITILVEDDTDTDILQERFNKVNVANFQITTID